MGHSGSRCYLPSLDFIGDVAYVLGRNTGDEGQLCMDIDGNGLVVDAIKKWAAFKSCRHSKKGNLTTAEREDVYYGMNITPCGPNGDVASFISRFTSEWTHLKPRGLATYNERCRINDFDGYNDASGCLFNMSDMTFPTEYTLSTGGTGHVTFRLGLNPAAQLATGSLLLTHLKLGGSDGPAYFSAMYFGLLFVNGNERRLITASSPLSSNAYGSEIAIYESGGALTGLTTGVTYSVYPVLSYLSHTAINAFANTDRIVSVPVSPFSFKVRPAAAAQNVAVASTPEPTAYMDFRNRLHVDFWIAMGGTPTSMSSVTYVVYAASSVGDTSGSQLLTGEIQNQLTTTNPVHVERSTGTITSTPWVRIYVYNTNNSSVNGEAYIGVTEEEPV